MYRHISDVAGSVPGPHNKARITVKRGVIFLLLEGLAFSLLKMYPL